MRGICESVMYITHKFFGVCPYRLARSGHWIFIPRTGVRIPVGTPEGFRPPERAAFLFFRCAKRGDGIFDKCQKPEGRAKRCSIPRLSQRVLGHLKERLFCALRQRLGSTPKRVDFNERRRIEPRPSICNFQSFYNRKPFVVSVSFSCGSLRLFRCFL